MRGVRVLQGRMQKEGRMGEMYRLEPQLPNVMMSIHEELAQRHSGFDDSNRWSRTLKPSWLSLQGGRLLSQLGNRLVVLGERLERYEPVRSSI